MDDVGKAVLGKQRGHAFAVGEVELGKLEAIGFCQLGEARLLQLRIVIVVHIIEADHGLAVAQQPPGDMKADETGGAGDQDGSYSRHRSMPSGFCPRSSLRFHIENGALAVAQQVAHERPALVQIVAVRDRQDDGVGRR